MLKHGLIIFDGASSLSLVELRIAIEVKFNLCTLFFDITSNWLFPRFFNLSIAFVQLIPVPIGYHSISIDVSVPN